MKKWTRTFVDRPSPKYMRAVGALTDLLEAEGADNVGRAYAEAVWEAERKAYLKTRGVRVASRACFHRLTGEKCDGSEWNQYGLPFDHQSLLVIGRTAKAFLSQPYDISLEHMRNIVAVCDRKRLDANISTWPAWHYPGGVISLEFTGAGEGIANRLGNREPEEDSGD